MERGQVIDATGWVGVVLVLAGICWIHPPTALVCLGVSMVATAIAAAALRRQPDAVDDEETEGSENDG